MEAETNSTLTVPLSLKDKQLADYAMSLDLLSNLPESTTEEKVIGKIFELFAMLYKPDSMVYLPFINGKMEKVLTHGESSCDFRAMKSWMMNLHEEYKWIDSENGFILRISHRSETLGIFTIHGISFPDYREHYLNLALTIIKVCGLAIFNARNYQKIKQSEESLKKANDELMKSQAQLIQAEKMSALGTMVAGIAHELNNPLMGIINFIRYCLKKTSTDDKRYSVLQDAEQETHRCIDIVDNLLTFSHMENKAEGGFKKKSCVLILEQVLKLLNYRIEAENIEVIKHYEEDIPEIRMRVNNIQQVFFNILVNALDALMESEKKEIHIKMSHEDKCIRVTIADSGPGIISENLKKIFDPFFTTKPPGKGTGLGLSISQGIVKMHEGTITCESKPRQGAKFNVLLPLEIKKRMR